MADEQQGGGGLFGGLTQQITKLAEKAAEAVNNNGVSDQAASLVGEAAGNALGETALDAEFDVSEAPDAATLVDGAVKAAEDYEAAEAAPADEGARGQLINALHNITQAAQQAAAVTQQALSNAAQTIETGYAAAVVDAQAEAEVEVQTDDREQADAAGQRKKEEEQEAAEAAADREADEREFQEQQQERHEAEMERIEAEAEAREAEIEAEAEAEAEAEEDEDDGDDPYSD